MSHSETKPQRATISTMVTTTFTRHEPIIQYRTSSDSDGLPDCMDLARQLSSPISSYEIYNGPEGPCIQHRRLYSVRPINAKERIRQLEDDIKFINEAREISLNWEIHSRIAQAINDTCIRKVPQQQYSDLKAAGHGYRKYSI
ncbi:hypothetical protein M378DRAFT_155091 [Amanita muscaria Koide BX008]|uniref:Uncharacterized protein n=1 Tax=Amanita muscaria (strain Koide BX008) TaxID=946122 RepID=A0A0C2XAV2_AMAMK|nr:hypothetical protein M378DRAFT_155091 [Amanita muscaria Koide BX008]